MAGDVEEPWLKFIHTEHKPMQAAFVCPHCRSIVYTLNNCHGVVVTEMFPGVREVAWSGVQCEVCSAMFDLFRSTYQKPVFHYTGSLFMYDSLPDDTIP